MHDQPNLPLLASAKGRDGGFCRHNLVSEKRRLHVTSSDLQLPSGLLHPHTTCRCALALRRLVGGSAQFYGHQRGGTDHADHTDHADLARDHSGRARVGASVDVK